MRVKIYSQYGALNSAPVLNSVKIGLERCGHTIVDNDEDLAVIWSVLWLGRMAGNKNVYQYCKKRSIPTMIVEVGNLIRHGTWRLSLDNINGEGYFANNHDLDIERPKKISVSLQPIKEKRKDHILIACQHHKSLQWEKMPPIDVWLKSKILEIRKYSDRPIIVRPHPRNPVAFSMPGVKIEQPRKIPGSYDDFDIDYNCHCVINHNSGPAVQAAIQGIPIVCDKSSLAAPVSDILENISTPTLPDRDDWFLKLTHTEWQLSEIENGYPFIRLLNKIS